MFYLFTFTIECDFIILYNINCIKLEKVSGVIK